jgi:demethylmenaquinone methyltransferase/2-methoxy-6-polyprenyl-1,4-benzoquinol methylase
MCATGAEQGRGPAERTERPEYRRFAGVYDLLLNPFLDRLRRRVVSLAHHAHAASVLDVACGTGRQCVLLHRAGIRAAGVDASPAMLAQARMKSPPQIPYHHLDATDLPFADQEFDAAVCSFVLHEQAPDERDATLAEARRAARRLILLDFAGPDAASRPGMLLASLPERLVGGDHYRHYRAFMDQGGLEGLLERHGLAAARRSAHFLGGVALVLTGPAA